MVERALPGSTHTDLIAKDIKCMGGFEGRCLFGGQFICDCVNINIYIYLLFHMSKLHKSIRQYHDSIFGALIHWYVYTYIHTISR